MKIKTFSYIIFFCSLFSLNSCTETPTYINYKPVNQEDWNRNTAITFDVDIQDTVSHFDIIVNIRNTTDYLYQNFWMFVDSESPEGNIEKDTIECFLANNRGEWLGNHFFSVHEMPVLYLNNIQFPAKGNYHFTIHQAMRDSSLIGIQEIGLNIIKKQEPNGEK